jgi:hypothetical protein
VSGDVAEVEIVSVVVPDAVRLVGLNTGVVAAGRPLTLKLTVPT